MRINRFVALATGLSRRAADKLMDDGQVSVDGATAGQGSQVGDNSIVLLNGKRLMLPESSVTILLNKPVGYVCSRNGQGSQTVYDLLPAELHNLKPVGRLDKDSSGLLLMTNDGELANQLTHPKFQKVKIYAVELDKPLTLENKARIERGIQLEDGVSSLQVTESSEQFGQETVSYRVMMSEGRNRQIRRTFAALGYHVTKLHRTIFGDYHLGDLKSGKYKQA